MVAEGQRDQRPKVSVLLITYNHVKFIRRAIESVLAQEGNFTCEIIIAEDCSTDGTQEICSEYLHTYPNKISVTRRTHNIGADSNFRSGLAMCRGDYIAYLEGDDYWVDSLKLSKQLDVLDADLGVSASCHAVEALLESRSEFIDARSVGYLSASDKVAFMWSPKDWPRARPATGSLVIRRNVLQELLASGIAGVPLSDAVILFAAHRVGEISYVPEVMGVYRVHEGGVWSGTSSEHHYRQTLSTVRSLIAHELFRDESIHAWLKQLFDFNAIKLAGRATSSDHFKRLSGIDWSDPLEHFSSNPWGLSTACQDLIAANDATLAARQSLSFRIGNSLVTSVKKARAALGIGAD